MEHLEIKQKPQMRPFIEKVHKSVFKYVLLACNMSADACKRIWLINAFIQGLTHFWLNILGLFLHGEGQNFTPDCYFW